MNLPVYPVTPTDWTPPQFRCTQVVVHPDRETVRDGCESVLTRVGP